MRNIQIDDTRIIRDIFAVSHLGGKPRSSYARFAEWYVGELFVRPNAAIPNARRDGFEESAAWESIRDEIDRLIATPFGRLAYRTSQKDQLSEESLTKRLALIEREATTLLKDPNADWDRVSLSVAEANDLQRRIRDAVKSADDMELAPLRAISEAAALVKQSLSTFALKAPLNAQCQKEVAEATAAMVQKIYKALKRRLGPSEWARARDVVRRATDEEPD